MTQRIRGQNKSLVSVQMKLHNLTWGIFIPYDLQTLNACLTMETSRVPIWNQMPNSRQHYRYLALVDTDTSSYFTCFCTSESVDLLKQAVLRIQACRTHYDECPLLVLISSSIHAWALWALTRKIFHSAAVTWISRPKGVNTQLLLKDIRNMRAGKVHCNNQAFHMAMYDLQKIGLLHSENACTLFIDCSTTSPVTTAELTACVASIHLTRIPLSSHVPERQNMCILEYRVQALFSTHHMPEQHNTQQWLFWAVRRSIEFQELGSLWLIADDR